MCPYKINMFYQLFLSLKNKSPKFFQGIFTLRDMLLNILVYFQIQRLRKNQNNLAVAYLSENFPKPPALRNMFAHGGSVKLTYLAENFPHHFPSAKFLYAVSSVGHPLQIEILEEAKYKGLKIVFNQNGVAFPAWDSVNYETTNHFLKKLIRLANFIIYQSQFCKESAEKYISPPNVPNEIVYNPVDTRLFSPDNCSVKPQTLTLLLGGNQYEKYRLELALQTLKALHRDVPNAKLIVTGNLWLPHQEAQTWTKQAVNEMNLTNHVTFTGAYTQSNAPSIYSQAHILLHTQYADSSPGLVLEAMAMGIPVVHLNNGGVPELVADASMGVHVEHDWENINLPAPQAMADAVLQIYNKQKEFSQKARQRAVDLFSLEKFIAKHTEIFEKIMAD